MGRLRQILGRLDRAALAAALDLTLAALEWRLARSRRRRAGRGAAGRG